MASSIDQDEPEKRPPWRPWWRWVISGLLAFHVTAVFLGPFAFSTRTPSGSSSEFARPLIGVFRPYVQAAFLDHGYAFFAPNPGASHLVRYKVEFADGREPVEGTFPDLKTQRPRLLYHRHFMLAERLHESFAPPTLESVTIPTPPGLDAAAQEVWRSDVAEQERRRQEAWQQDRQVYDALWSSFEQHLLQRHGGASVSLVRIEHSPPRPFLVGRLGLKLDDESLYRRLIKDDSGEAP